MSIETTQAQAAARDAEAAWARHKPGCISCGSKRRPVVRCPAGRQLAGEAAELRRKARESARADREPSDADVPLFDLAEIGVTAWTANLRCGHGIVVQSKPKPGEYLSCLEC